MTRLSTRSLRRPLTAILAVFALVAAACGGNEGTPQDAVGGLKIVVTTTILGDITANVAGADASVEVLLPVGADPHGYQASAKQAAAIQDADLVIANGLLLEDGLLDLLESAEADGANILELGEHLDPIPFGGDGDLDDAGDADDHGVYDPHIWMDPVRMADAARLIARQLSALDANTDWAARAETYAAALLDTHQEIEQILSGIPAEARKLVTNHQALGYFADRYGFTIIGVVIPGGSTLADPSSAEMAALIRQMEEEEVRVIFAETTEPATLAEAVAGEIGESVEVVELHTGSLGEPGSGADTLIGLLLTDAERIAAASTAPELRS